MKRIAAVTFTLLLTAGVYGNTLFYLDYSTATPIAKIAEIGRLEISGEEMDVISSAGEFIDRFPLTKGVSFVLRGSTSSVEIPEIERNGRGPEIAFDGSFIRIKGITRHSKATIYDLKGNVMMEYALPANEDCVIPISELENGCYIISIDGTGVKFIR